MRTRWLAVLLAASSLPAWAQQPTPSGTTAAQDTPADATEPPPPVQSADPARRAADDAQLPPYLRSANEGASFDPWEHYNRGVFRFNKGVDNAFLKPLATAYVRDVPEPLRDGVSHFFVNLKQPVTAVNLVLQGHPGLACRSLGRFAINTTIGIGGLFDPATHMHVPLYDEDFGQTLGRWGWRRSRYFLLPFMGPGTMRDRIGSIVDTPFGPIRYLHPVEARIGVIGLEVLDTRASILPLDELGAGIDDDYILVREAWSQRRTHQIDDLEPAAGDAPPTVR
jgi:phospholipid-binding lipoprotein MlaA